jgi:hypothetical protein
VKTALGRLEGVREVEARPGTLRVYITPAEGRTVDLAAIEPALRREGIRPVWMRIHAEGRMEPGPRFRITGWPVAYPAEGARVPEGNIRVRAQVQIEAGAIRLRILER